MGSFYWERHPDGPFVTLIEVATTYLDPESSAAVSPAEHHELATLLSAVGLPDAAITALSVVDSPGLQENRSAPSSSAGA